MEKETKKKWDQIKLFLWIIFIFNVLIFFLAIIFGNNVGYILSLKGHFLLAALITSVLAITLIVFLIADPVFKYFNKSHNPKKYPKN